MLLILTKLENQLPWEHKVIMFKVIICPYINRQWGYIFNFMVVMGFLDMRGWAMLFLSRARKCFQHNIKSAFFLVSKLSGQIIYYYYAFCNISSYDILAYITQNYIALIYYAKIVHLLCQFHAGKVGFSAVCQAKI